MLCVYPFCQSDVADMLDLLLWVKQLGGCKEHDALLVADAGTQWDSVLEAVALAKESYRKVDLITNPKPVAGWIAGSDDLFLTATKHVQEHYQTHWFWNEPDAIPLKAGWLDVLDKAYKTNGKPFLGSIIQGRLTDSGQPFTYMNGVAIYPANAHSIVGASIDGKRALDMCFAEIVRPLSANTLFIQNMWGELNNPPTFSEHGVRGTSHFDLANLTPQAVVFHRCKGGSLTRLLRSRSRVEQPEAKELAELLLVLPFCNHDIQLFLKNVKWMMDLGGCKDYDVLLSYEAGVNLGHLAQMRNYCGATFKKILEYSYPKPPPGVWPPTHAFIAAANLIEKQIHRPWLWCEYDMIPLKKGWIQTLDAEYKRCGKSFMGPIVQGMGHMNGTGIYPHNTPSRIPKSFKRLETAWDLTMKEEMIHDCHNCNHLLQHAWVMNRGRLQAAGGGFPPSFKDPNMLRTLFTTAVVFHRCKDGTLIDRLRERNR